MRKYNALGTNKAARIPTHGGSHISYAAKLHYDNDFLSRIRESMNGPWAINGPCVATHTHPTGASLSFSSSHLFGPPCMLALSRDRSRGVSRRLRRRCTKLRGGAALFFFPLVSPRFSFLSRASDSPERRKDRTPGYDLAVMRPCMHACVRTYMRYYTAPKGERARVVLGKTFSGTCENRLDRAPEYKIKLAVRWRASRITSSSVTRLIYIILASDSFLSSLLAPRPVLL